MPSDEHIKLSAKAIKWVANLSTRKGIRGATEIYISKGYLADAVALCRFQSRFEQAYEASTAIFDHLCIFEIKVSKNDFQKTFIRSNNGHINRLTPIGTFHWCVTPRGLIDREELPDFWGLLETSGSGLRESKQPIYCKADNSKIYSIGYNILWKHETNKYLGDQYPRSA